LPSAHHARACSPSTDWKSRRGTNLVSQLRRELGERGIAVHALDAREGMTSWETIVASTSSTKLADDPDFETLADTSLEDLFRRPVQAENDTDASSGVSKS
jgi:hypothetical protein